jgi:hypothetical protein
MTNCNLSSVRSRLPIVQTADRIVPALGATIIALELTPGQVLGASFSNPGSGLFDAPTADHLGELAECNLASYAVACDGHSC